MVEHETSESGNWNVSGSYVEQIAELFREANQYKEMAKYGFTDILLDLNTKENQKVNLRMRGLEKYIYKLKDIIMYCHFAMKTETKKNDFLSYYKDLEFIEDNTLKNIVKTIANGFSNKVEIDENLFDLTYRKLVEIDMKMREPMNQADLIFIQKETFDPHEFKNKVADRFIEGG